MSAIEQCRSAALGGHVLRCPACGATEISYNSCRNRHCPKCRSSAAQRWLEARQADLLTHHCHIVETGNESIRFNKSTADAKKRIKVREQARKSGKQEPPQDET